MSGNNDDYASSRESTPNALSIVEDEIPVTQSTAVDESRTCAGVLPYAQSSNSQTGTLTSIRASSPAEESGVVESVLHKLATNDNQRRESGRVTPDSSPASDNSDVMSPDSREFAKGKFDWQAYLMAEGAQAAPNKCFYQADTPPINKFRVDEKLETNDPRSPDQLCLATIVAVYKVWIQIRLDGCDDSNDFWVMCDDVNLHPVEYSSRSGRNLVPPVGSQRSIERWVLFLDAQINKGERAYEDVFKPIDESFMPRKNRFKVGYRLEAIDKGPGQFVGKISPATVIEVKGKDVTIKFDGWSAAYNKTIRYSSRDIFPIDWAATAGVCILQPPKKKLAPVRKSAVRAEGNGASVTSVRKSAPKKSGAKRESKSGSKDRNEEAMRHKRKRSTPSRTTMTPEPAAVPVKVSNIMPPPVEEASKQIPSPGCTKKVHKKVAYGPILHGSLGARARKSCGMAAMRQHTVNNTNADTQSDHKNGIKNGSGLNELRGVFAPHIASRPASELSMTVYVTPGCSVGNCLNQGLLAKMAPVTLGPNNLNQVLRMCVQLLIDCSSRTEDMMQKIKGGSSPITVTADLDGRRLCVKNVPVFQHVAECVNYLANLLQALGACPNLLAYTKHVECYQCSQKKRSHSEDSEESRMSSNTDRDGPNVIASRNVESWTQSEVCQFLFTETGDQSTADSFLAHEVDGKALVMLTPELLIKHMDMRLGPALKIYGLIQRLRASQ